MSWSQWNRTLLTIEFGYGGVWEVNAPDLLFYEEEAVSRKVVDLDGLTRTSCPAR